MKKDILFPGGMMFPLLVKRHMLLGSGLFLELSLAAVPNQSLRNYAAARHKIPKMTVPRHFTVGILSP